MKTPKVSHWARERAKWRKRKDQRQKRERRLRKLQELEKEPPQSICPGAISSHKVFEPPKRVWDER